MGPVNALWLFHTINTKREEKIASTFFSRFLFILRILSFRIKLSSSFGHRIHCYTKISHTLHNACVRELDVCVCVFVFASTKERENFIPFSYFPSKIAFYELFVFDKSIVHGNLILMRQLQGGRLQCAHSMRWIHCVMYVFARRWANKYINQWLCTFCTQEYNFEKRKYRQHFIASTKIGRKKNIFRRWTRVHCTFNSLIR